MSSAARQLTFQTCIYKRPFVRPLISSWGEWAVRKGVLVRIEDSEGNIGLGEVAPLSSFGSESLNESIQYLVSIPAKTDWDNLNASLQSAPSACAFGLWTAMEYLASGKIGSSKSSGTAGLIALGYNLEKRITEMKNLGIRSYKIKVGLKDPDWERGLLEKVLHMIEPSDRIRIDPNQSWDRKTLQDWSEWLLKNCPQIEFIEEPLTPNHTSREEFVAIAKDSAIPLALDESLSSDGLEPWQDLGWPGYWIMKPSLQGVPDWIKQVDHRKVVLSSIFETGIGLSAIISLSNQFPDTDHGLGTTEYFNDGLGPRPYMGRLSSFNKDSLEGIWSHFNKT